jgi:spore maturation protein CgeB
MSLKIFFISSMYSGYLDSFYNRHNDIKQKSFDEHYKLLSEETTEFVGSYTRGLNKQGVDARFVVANDELLQSKWAEENGLKHSNSRDILFGQVKLFQPDILWIDNLSFIDREWLENIRKSIKSIRLIVGYHCSPYGSKILETLKAVDFVFTCTPGLKAEIENRGIRSYLVYHAFDHTLVSKIPKDNNSWKENLVFSGSLISGTKYHDERIKLIENILKEKIDISLYVNLEKQYKIKAKQTLYLIRNILCRLSLQGLAERIHILDYGKTKIINYSDILLKSVQKPVYGSDMYKLFSSSKIILNMHIGVAGDYAGNMRLFEVTGTGSCLLTDNKKNIGDLFDIDNEIVVYNSPDDCIKKAKWLLEHDDERNRIAEAGHLRTLKSHTVEKRCIQIIDILENELKKSTK